MIINFILNIFLKKINNLLISKKDFGFYSLSLILIIPIFLIFYVKKFDYVSIYTLGFVTINLYSIYISAKNDKRISLFFSVIIFGLYSLNSISFLFYYDNIPNLVDETISETRLRASHLFSRTLFEQIVANNPNEIHKIFLFLINSYLIIFFTLMYYEKKLKLNFSKQINKKEKKIQFHLYYKNVIFLLILSFSFLILFNKNLINYSSFTAILSAILRIDNFIILVICFYFFFENVLKKKEKFTLLFIFLLLLSYYIFFTFSKAIILLLCLAVFSNVILLNKKISISIFQLLILFLLFGFTFFTATFLVNPNIVNLILLFAEGAFFEFVFTGLIGRLSYFEFYIEKVVNIDFYDHVTNLNYYLKVIIDKLTPGFDIFNIGFASRELYKSYFIFSDPNIMNSEQITVFAEAYILFKYYAIFYYFLVSLSLIYLLKTLSKNLNFINYLIMNYILYIFLSWLIGIGLDQLIIKIELLTIFIILFILFNKFIKKILIK